MPRPARIVVPTLPHLVTARARAGQRLFYDKADFALYRDLLAGQARRAEVAVWAWVAVPASVQLIAVPPSAEALAQAIGEAHRRYAAIANAKLRCSGPLFRKRFSSMVLDEAHLLLAIRYLAMAPVRERLVNRPEEWPFSSARAHAGLAPDGLTLQAPVLARIPNFAGTLHQPADDPGFAVLREAERLERPLGSEAFVAELEARLGRTVRPQKRGRKPKQEKE